MLRLKYIATAVLMVALLASGKVPLWAHSTLSNGDSGETGSPLDGAGKTCLGCHNATSTSNPASGIGLTGITGTTYTPGTTYAMTLTLTGASGKNGFEITAETPSKKIGTFVAGTNDRVLSTNWLGQSSPSFTSWTFSFVAPAAGTGNFCFYVIVMENSSGQSGPEWLNSFCYTEGGGGSAPSITSQPASQTVNVGQTATFSLVATGATSYQWQKAPSGSSTFSPIGGATAASYTTPATVAGDTGSQFNCVVTGSGGSVTSNAATLTVFVPVGPTITAPPSNQTVSAGLTATFSVTASGTAPLSYQWQKAPSGSTTFSNITSATSASYTTPATVLGDSGSQYQCVVTNSVTSATSSAATLTVTAVAASITTPPANQSVLVGQTATFNVAASGTPPLTYQWQSAPSGSSSYTNIASATSASYTTPAALITDSGETFRCIVNNSAAIPATSAAATLTVSATATAPSITTQPTNQSATVGGTATFTVAASGTAPLSYQWQMAPAGSSTFTNITSATLPSYTSPATTLGDSGSQYRCAVSNSVNPPATSNAATLTVSAAAPSIVSQPISQSVGVGQTASFNITAAGTPPLTYQWQSAPAGSSTYGDITGATSLSYTTPATLLTDTGKTFRCVVNNSSMVPATSNAATLTVTAAPPPTITQQPSPQTVTAPQSATFSLTASGTAPLTYQWQSAPPGSSTFSNIIGATLSSYSTPATASGDNGKSFKCVVTDGNQNSATSIVVLLTVGTGTGGGGAPAIATQPVDVRVLTGQGATFTVAATNPADPTITYTWYRDGTALPASFNGSPSYTLNVVTPPDNGSRFYCLLSNVAGSVTSNTAQVFVGQALAAPVIANLQAVMSTADTLYVGTVYPMPMTYTWTLARVAGAAGYPAPGLAGSVVGTSAPAQASTSTGFLALATMNLTPGQYQLTVFATDPFTNVSPTTTATFTALASTLDGVRVYPNPWRSDKEGLVLITFDRLPPNATIKIFTVSGHQIKSLDVPTGSVTWDLTNEAGTKVASGLYLYLIKAGSGEKARGKLAIIR